MCTRVFYIILNVMKTRLKFTGALLAAMLLVVLSFVAGESRASTTTTLYSQDFSRSTFVPAGWTDNSYSDYGGNYAGTGSGWYWSSTGYNGSNGSALCDYWDGCVGPIITPVVDASFYSAAGDTAYVDFDFFWAYNQYDQDYDVSQGVDDQFFLKLINSSGSSTVLSLVNHTDYTYAESGYNIDYTAPTTPGAWRHYHIGIPQSYRSSSLQVAFDAEYYSGWGLETGAIDNVVITGTHYNKISYAPASLTFPSTSTGVTTAAKSVIVQNPNPVTVTFSGVSITGTQAGEFTITHSIISLPPGTPAAPSVDSFSVTFSPQGSGTRTASLNFNNNSEGPISVSVPLTGTGVAPSIDLKGVNTLFLKTRTKLSKTRDEYVVVYSAGTGSLIVSPTSFLSGDYPSEYSILRLPSSPIPSGTWDTVWVRYSPTMEGSRPAILNIVSNAANGTQQVSLRGIGILPRLTISPSPLNFDSVGVGDTVCADVTLTNPGTDTIAITHNYFANNDADFTYFGMTGDDSLIAPDHFKTVHICFSPIRNGARTARLRVTTSIPKTFDVPSRDTSSFTINVLGTGVPYGKLAIAAKPIVDSGIVGKQICRTDTIRNTGSADLTITSATITGADSSDYVLSGATFPLTIAAGKSQVVNICATPGARGDRNAQLNIKGSTSGKSITAALPLDVFGQIVCASASPNAAFNAKTCIGMSDTATIEVTNCGDITTAYTATLTGASGYTIVGPASSSSVGATGKTSFKLVFTPTARGAASGTLTITDGASNAMPVSLSGSGGAASVSGAPATAPDTKVGATSAEFGVSLKNDGECDWTPGLPAGSGPFTCTKGSNVNIAAGATGTLTFTFTPTVKGLATANLTFPNPSSVSIPAATLTLSGNGIEGAGVRMITEVGGFSLAQNYPNPFNPTTEIRFTLPREANVRMDITDMKGNLIRTVFSERYAAGTHSTVVDASQLSSGAYYYTLTTSDGAIKLTRQMMLVK
jgi:hypothetical protein